MLRAAGLYCTAGKVMILKVLMQASKPLTHKQIALKLGKKGLNKVTIYRSIEGFVRAGLVHKAFLHNRTWHFELADNCTDSQCHPHFTCRSCGDTQCLTELSVPVVNGLKKGFVLQRQRVQLEGLCSACTAKKTK